MRMAREEDQSADKIPDFDDVWPDLEVRGELLAAAATDDQEAVAELQARDDVNWWNVAWTLALLLSKFRAGEQSTVKLVQSLIASEPDAESTPPGE